MVVLVILVAGVAVAHADADPKKQLIGKWAPKEEQSVTIEFQAAGKFVIIQSDPDPKKAMTINGTYKWIDKATIEVSMVDGKDTKTERIKVAFDGADALTTTDKDGKAEKFTRVKK